MADISQGSHADIVLSPSDVFRVSTGGTATVVSNYGAPAGTTTLTAQAQDFGPYLVPAKLQVNAVSGGLSYALVAPPAFTSAEIVAGKALVSGGGIQVAPTFLGAYGGVTMDAGSGNVMPTMRVVVNAATDVVAAEQIASNGAQAFTGTIAGAGATGEVMVLATGLVNITSVHVGFSTGSSQTVSSDSTITVNELVRFDFDAADNVSSVRINFSPPRTSGRYIDVSAIGQQRS